MTIEFTRKTYLRVWRDERYISQHVSVLEAAESASADAEVNGDGDYEIRVGSEVWYSVSIRDTLISQAQGGLIIAPNASPPINSPPVWDTQPGAVANFVFGTASSIDMDDISSDPDADTITHTMNTGTATLPTGVTWTAATGVLAYDGVGAIATTTGHINTLNDGTDSTASSAYNISIAEVSGFIMSKNQNGFSLINTRDRAHDNTHPFYLLARVGHYMTGQLTNMLTSSGRATEIPKWDLLHDDNPLMHVWLHFQHMTAFAGHRHVTGNLSRYYYDYMNNNPIADTIVFIDQDVTDEINFNNNSLSAGNDKGAPVTFKFTNLAARTWAGQYAADIMLGTNLSGDGPNDARDVSDYMNPFHDSTPISLPQSNQTLYRIQVKGSVSSIVSTRPSTNHLRIVEIDAQPNPPTSGALPEDGSFSALVTTHNIGFLKPGGTGFIGYHAIGYKNVSGGNSQLYMDDFTSKAASTQSTVPASGWDYALADMSNRTSTVDWNSDGTPTGPVTSQTQWGVSWGDYWDKYDAHIVTATTHGAGRAWNGLSRSFTTKENNGWPAIHEHLNSSDAPTSEHWQEQFGMDTGPTSGPHEYDVSSTSIAKGMRAISFASSWVRSSSNPFIQNKARGAVVEIEPWGGFDDYTDVTDLDASFSRFFLAVIRTVPDLILQLELFGGQSTPTMIEEQWLDFDTNWTTPAQLGTYDAAGGATGNNGPKGSWAWATPEAGNRIFIRRFGNWLCAMNCDDAPGGYSIYAPSHLPGGFTPRTTADEITPAVFAQLYTDGVLSTGETLRHFNPVTYKNARATNWLIANANTDWSNHNYGPRQSHPSDANSAGGGSYTLSNNPAIARDSTLNDGTVVSQGASYFLGPLEAVFWEIENPGVVAPLSINTTNNRYFDYKGNTIWLGGNQHFRPIVSQASQIDIPAIMDVPGDIDVYISMMVTRGMNYVRLLSWFGSSQISTLGNSAVPLPFERTGPGNANDGDLKFDLTKYDAAYDARVLSFITKCFENDIIVSVEFWDVYGVASNRLQGSCFTAANNINSIDADVDGDGEGYDGMYESPTGAMTNIQTAYEEHVVDQLNHLPNVFYEGANELGSISFQTAWVTRMKAYIATKANTQLVYISHGGRVDDNVGSHGTFDHYQKAEVVGTGADVISVGSSPGGLTDWEPTALDFRNNPPIHTEFNMPLVADVDHIQFGLHDHIHLWKCFTRGYHYNIYEDGPDFDEPTGWEAYMNQATDDVVRRNFLVIQTIIGKLTDLANLIPSTSVATTNYALFWAGQEYIVWSESASNFTVSQLVNGVTYDYEWYDTDVFAINGTGSVVVSGTSNVFTPPSSNHVLFLKRQ